MTQYLMTECHVRSLIKFLVIAVLLLPLFSTSSRAQSTKQQIEDLKQQIETIQRQNQEQIDQLKKQIELMESAREADQEKIAEVVKKEDDAWYNNFKAKYKKGLVFQSEDGKFKMRFRLRGQFQASVTDRDGANTSTNFSIARVRMKWDGHAYKPWLLYALQLGARDSVSLRDLYFTVAYNKSIMPRVGQNKVPFSRGALNSSSALQFVTRSIVDGAFAYGRDRGISVYGALGNNSNYSFSYGAGVYNGDGRNGRSTDSNMLYVGRIQFGVGGEGNNFGMLFRGNNASFPTEQAYKLIPNFAKSPTFVVGAAIAGIPGLNTDRKTPDGSLANRMEELGVTVADVTSITADMNFKMPVFNVQGTYMGRWISPEEGGADTAYDQGFNIQAGVFLMPKTLEFAGRFSYIDYDTNAGVVPPGMSIRDVAWAITPGINYYISHDHRWKVQLQYSYLKEEFTEDAPNVNSNILRAQLQVYF